MIRKLFRLGDKSEKMVSSVLPENLASLFGAEEGEKLEVEATEAGLAAIEAAESDLVKIGADHQQALDKISAHADEVAEIEGALAEANATVEKQEAEIKKLGALPAGNLTSAASSDTVVEGGVEKAVSKHKQKELDAREKARKMVESQTQNAE